MPLATIVVIAIIACGDVLVAKLQDGAERVGGVAGGVGAVAKAPQQVPGDVAKAPVRGAHRVPGDALEQALPAGVDGAVGEVLVPVPDV